MIINATIERILQFRDERNWRQFHTPKDLAISIVLEASELLENFQWTKERDDVPERAKELEEELADVLMYCVYMADVLGLDMDDILNSKLEKNKAKYPVEASYGNSRKYSEFGSK